MAIIERRYMFTQTEYSDSRAVHDLPQNLKQCRLGKNMSQKAVAEAAGIKRSRYERAEGGYLFNWFNADEIDRLAQVLEVNPSILM